MNATVRTLALLTIGIVSLHVTAFQNLDAQPVMNGDMAGTCFSGSNPGGYVVGLYNVQLASLQPLNMNWIPPMSHGPTNNWTRANLGEVFGVDFDGAGNIWVSASRVYNSNSPPGGPGGSGAVYRIDGVTGMISNPVSTLNAACGSVVGTTTIPNTGPGLGNLCHDPANNQLFVTNFEDGKIYRISMTGTILSTFDPFAPDSCVIGVAPLGERIWGINVYKGRVYFSRWVEDQGPGHGSSSTANEIWSVALNGSGDFTGTAQLEITLPAISGVYSNPVSDIAFSTGGRMLLAERSMYSSASNPYAPSAHQSRLLEYVISGSSWVPSGSTYVVGAYSIGNNSAGGCDYGYGSYDQQKRLPVDCDSTVWVSGDALHLNPGDYIYGWANMPALGGGPASSIFIDADGDVMSGDKTQIGDLEVYKRCADQPSDPCAEIRVTSKPVQSPTGEGGCCFDLTVTGIPANTFSTISAQLLTPSVSFTGVIGPTGWGVTNTGTYATWDSAGIVPGGTSTGLRFCLYSLVSPPQQVEITFHGLDGTVCRDTLTFDCEQMPPPIPPCVTFGKTELTCKQTGPNGSVYDLSFTVTNNSPFSLAPYNMPAENIIAYPITPNITLSPGSVALSPVLGYGQTSGPLPFTISGTGAKPGDTVCIVVQLHGKKLQQDYQWCCPPDTLCFVLPPCKDCCDSVDIAVKQTILRQVGNNGANIMSSVNVTPGPVMSASATVMGVSRSSVWCPKFGQGGWNYVQTSSPTVIVGQISNASITPSLPLMSGITPPSAGVSWGTVPAGVNIGGSIGLQLSFPGSSLGWRCRDTLTICVKYSFTDTACRTCDTLVYYTLARTGQIQIVVSDPVDLRPASVRATDPIFQPTPGAGSSPLYGERLVAGENGPGLELEMTDASNGTLSVMHWWQDNLPGDPMIRLTRMYVEGTVGRDIVSISETGGATGRVLERVARIPIDLNKGETDQFQLGFENPNGAAFFPVTVRFDYVSTSNERDTLRSRDYTLFADTRRGDTVRLRVKELDKATPYLYKLQVSAGDYDTTESIGPVKWMAPESIRITAPQGTGILASGPMADSTQATFRVRKRIDKATPMLMQYSLSSDYEDGVIPPNGSADLWLVMSAGSDPFDLMWEGLNGRGDVISEGTITLSPTSTVRDGDDIVPGATISLLDAWPNPATDRITARYRLESSDRITLSLYDAAGREISVLLDNEPQPAGSNSTTFDSRTLPEGTYILRLETSHGVQSRKVVVVR